MSQLPGESIARSIRAAKYYLTIILLLIMAAAVFPIQAAEESPQERKSPVEAVPIEEKTVSLNLELVGTSAPNRTSRVAAGVEGLVLEVNFKQGDPIQKGAPLIKLDQTNSELVLDAALAAKAAADIRLEQARQNLIRSDSLKKSRTISDISYEKDLFQVKTAEQDAVRAQAEAARLSDRISRMTVLAPFTGYIVDQHTEVGQWLNPGAPVATLIELSTIKVKAPLPERYISEIRHGDPAQVTFDALGDEIYHGQVSSIIPMAEEGSRNLPLEVSLPNKGSRIKAGLLARVALSGSPRKVLLVPKDALVLNKGKATIFIIKEDTAFPVPVTPGSAHGPKVEITGKIKPGQMVVIQGNERLRPGQKVQIITPQSSE